MNNFSEYKFDAFYNNSSEPFIEYFTSLGYKAKQDDKFFKLWVSKSRMALHFKISEHGNYHVASDYVLNNDTGNSTILSQKIFKMEELDDLFDYFSKDENKNRRMKKNYIIIFGNETEKEFNEFGFFENFDVFQSKRNQ